MAKKKEEIEEKSKPTEEDLDKLAYSIKRLIKEKKESD